MRLLRFFAAPVPRQWDVRASFAAAAEATGINEDTARSRIRRMEQEGLIRGWQVVPHPGLLGMVQARLDVQPADMAGKRRLLEAFPSIPGAHLAFELYGDRVAMVLFQRADDLPPVERLVSTLCGGTVVAEQILLPRPEVDLDRKDWQLMQALRRAPRAPYAELAKALGLSEKTIQRRLDRLTRGRALFLSLDIDLARLSRGLACRYSVLLHKEASTPQVDALRARIESLDRIFLVQPTGPSWGVSRLAATPLEADEIRTTLAAEPAVAEVRLDIVLRRVTHEGWLDAEIARQVGEVRNGAGNG